MLIIWEGYWVFMEIGYCYIEKFLNLESLFVIGFIVSCFLVKIKGVFVGFIWVVVILEE